MDTPKIIALYSSAPKCGKSTAARILTSIDNRFVVLKFAGALKSMLLSLFLSAGYTQKQALEYIEGDKKDEPLSLFGYESTRYLMQTLGTEWGRNTIDERLWVNIAEARMEKLLKGGKQVVIDDLRFPNEFTMLKKHGAVIWKIDRDVPRNTEHCSEGACDKFGFDDLIVNDCSMREYVDKVFEAYKRSAVE